MTVTAVFLELVRHPYRHLLRRWNWKSALLSSSMRAGIFFGTNLRSGIDEAVGAMLAEFAFRAMTSGFYGAITQAFRRAEPAWQGAMAVMILLPLCTHSLEFLVHWARGTPNLVLSIMVSAGFTAVSTLFNWFAMRRGALIVGEDSQSLWHDMRRMPRIVAAFLVAGPLAVGRWIARGLEGSPEL